MEKDIEIQGATYRDILVGKLKKLSKYPEKYEEEWLYAGGNKGRHRSWWDLNYRGKQMPPEEVECICTHHIKENCFIENKYTKKLYVIGNECIGHFIPAEEGTRRRCKNCEEAHRNRKTPYCNDCRDYYCAVCYKKRKTDGTHCKECKKNLPEKITIDFGKYKGKKLLEIFSYDLDYCAWITCNINDKPIGKVLREKFIELCEENHDNWNVFKSGRYKGKSFEDVDEDYINWYRHNGPSDVFKAYIFCIDTV